MTFKNISKNLTKINIAFITTQLCLYSIETLKDDSGDWSVEVSNDSGTCQVNFPLTIKATPGACRAPVKVSDTTFNTAMLAWTPPTDDGGSPVTHYVVEKKEVGKSYWTTVTSQASSISQIKNLT